MGGCRALGVASSASGILGVIVGLQPRGSATFRLAGFGWGSSVQPCFQLYRVLVASWAAKVPETAAVVILKGLDDLLRAIHHKRSLAGDRLVQRLAVEK